MKWLVWKEYRLNRLILIVGAVLLLAPYLIGLVVVWCGAGLPLAKAISTIVWASGMYSMTTSQLTLALLGGHVIACERADRSAEFLAYLPLSRTRILAGKIALVVMTVAVVWSVNLLTLWLAIGKFPVPRDIDLVSILGFVTVTGLVFLCVGWLLSSILQSPTFAICGSLITPFMIVMGVQALAWALEYDSNIANSWYRHVCLTLAPVCFVAGTWYYLRRVEP